MKKLDFLVIPGTYGQININDIRWVDIKEEYILISWDSGMHDCKYLLRGKFMPNFIRNATQDDYYPYHALSEDDFEKYKVAL